MWTYQQSSGGLSHNGALVGIGYSGHEAGLNNHSMEADAGLGPIPCGRWNIGPLSESHPHLGPHVMALTPAGFDPHGRSAFFMHGDSRAGDHSASHGCIIMPKSVRLAVTSSGDHDLEVVA